MKNFKICSSTIACLLCLFCTPDAGAETFLKISGITGPSQVAKHIGEFETLNCTFTVTGARSMAAGGTAQSPHSMTVTLALGPEAWYLLKETSAPMGPTSTAIKQAVLTFVTKDSRGLAMGKEIVVKLGDVTISETRVDSGTGIFNGNGAVVTLTLTYRTEEFTLQ